MSSMLSMNNEKMKSFSLFVVLFGLIAFAFIKNEPVVAKQPNVLFIAVDDLNDWVGCCTT